MGDRTQIFGSYIDNAGDLVEDDFWVERVTRGFPVITTDHALIHDKKAYTLSGFIDTIANTQTAAIAITCPADSYVHFKPVGVVATGRCKITLRENATFTGGTAITPRNRNRRGSNDNSITTCKVLANATVTGTNTPIAHGFIPGGGQGASRIGGAAESAEEHVLGESITYVLTIENTSGGDITAMYDFFWYEEAGA